VTEPPPKRPAPPVPAPPPGPARPRIEQWPIPFSPARRRDTARYAERHYGTPDTTLDPRVIVEHYTVTDTAQAAYDIFARNEPDVELQELPGLCTHFLIDRDGTIHQLVPLELICRHTVGLNDVAIGIEHVGGSDADVMQNAPQLEASLALTAWLRCRFDIRTRDVIGHAESLSSPYHHEGVPALRSQTHADFQPATMDGYRRRLSRRGC
jgi:beta-N-acetylhexosaminidase